MRVKICGITRVADALVAERAGADAIGLVFAERSQRRVGLERAAEVSAALGPFVARVGVFVDAPLEEVERAVVAARLTAVQLHGAEDAAYARRLRGRVQVIRALAFEPGLTPAALADYPADAFLLDAAVPGSGVAFGWHEAAAWRGHPRLVLAGGLTPANVTAGIAALAPYAVDVASGVESAPCVKSAELVERFVAAARAAPAAPTQPRAS